MDLPNYQTGLSRDMIALMIQNMTDHEMGKVVPDTLGADYFFLEGFLTDKMDWDFPYIERDFLMHHYERLQEFYHSAWYGNDSAKDSSPAESLEKKILAMLYNGAKLGDEYCVALIKNLYRLYHKKEYNQLKRFRKMSYGTVTVRKNPNCYSHTPSASLSFSNVFRLMTVTLRTA